MVGKGKWRVINGKWTTPPTSSTSTTTTFTDTFQNNKNNNIPDSLKYGSLDRRLLSKHRHAMRTANLSRTNSCEDMEDAMSGAASSLKRTSPVQLSRFRSNLGNKLDANNNNADDDESVKVSSNKVKLFVCTFYFRNF